MHHILIFNNALRSISEDSGLRSIFLGHKINASGSYTTLYYI